MIPKHSPRAVLALWFTLALVLAAMAGPALTAAAIPSVYISVENAPEATQGQLVGFKITVDNQGNSNSSQSMASATVPAGTTYTGVFPSSTSCSEATGLVTCNLGSIPGNTSVTFSLTFQTTSATTSPVTTTVRGFTTGTPGDPGGNSHGDDFIFVGDLPSITLVSAASGDFSGRFVTTNLVVQNNQTVGSSNLQATKLTAPISAIGVSVKDGPGVPNLGDCTLGPSVCGLLFGQNSNIYVDGNTTFATAFPVTVTFSKFEIPGGINETNIAIYHTWTDATGFHEDTISDRCTFATPSSTYPQNPECLTAKKSSTGITVVVWLFHNGNIHAY
jgi:uncharacterized repeat protein (TIGR01451 family)